MRLHQAGSADITRTDSHQQKWTRLEGIPTSTSLKYHSLEFTRRRDFTPTVSKQLVMMHDKEKDTTVLLFTNS
jgi:hypothetical protein